jgi:hypothetical protein
MTVRRSMVALLVVLSACATGALRDAPNTSDATEKWVETYYEHREVTRLPRVLEEMDRGGVFGARSAQRITSAWLSTVLAQPEVRPEQVVAEAKLGTRARRALAEALSNAGRSDLAKEIASADGWSARDARKLEAPAVALRTVPIAEPADLDRMWGAFFASGDALYVRRVIDCLNGSAVVARPGSTVRAMTIEAAHWSVRAIARVHPRVLEICEQESRTRTGPMKDTLERVIAEVRATAPASAPTAAPPGS